MMMKQRRMNRKNAAVGQVQAIHDKPEKASIIDELSLLHAPEGETLSNVVAHEIDNHRARDQGERSRSGKEPELIAGRAGGLCHKRSDGFCRHRGQGLRQKKLDPREHEAEEAGDADAGGDGRYEDSYEEMPEGIAVDIGGLIELLGHAR